VIKVARLARQRLTMTVSVVALSVAVTAPAYASGSSMPWEQPLQQILQSIEGPVAKIIAVIIIITTGLIQIVFGLSIAFAASSFFLSFFSFGGGALV
jgi:type IV secretion system protein VirB2